jgi:hypothetical protein
VFGRAPPMLEAEGTVDDMAGHRTRRERNQEMNEHPDRVRVGSGERVTVTPDGPPPRTIDTDTPTTHPAARPASAARREAYVDRDRDYDVEIPEALNLTRDRVRWGPIVAGFLTALTSLLLLGLLGAAIGLTAVNAGDAAAQGAVPGEGARNSAIWGAISGIIAFFLGGYVAGRTAAIFDRGWGALNGALVFLLAVPFTLWLAGQGLGAVLGTLGSFAGGLNADPGQAQGAAQNVAGQAQQAAQTIQPVDVARAAERARNAAWGALVGSLLALGASALGGALGTRREVNVDRATGRVTD